jgi:hypothetical protein
MRDCIRDFVDSWKQYDSQSGVHSSNWNSRLADAGYHRVELIRVTHWNDVHIWCEDIFGKQHYAWVGNEFWFECKENALLFQLKWI